MDGFLAVSGRHPVYGRCGSVLVHGQSFGATTVRRNRRRVRGFLRRHGGMLGGPQSRARGPQGGDPLLPILS
ncbi:hypothetical protein JKG47_01700 [Acidithiobacillus sp. MC6.1]|nr:hypothetical protein [Acidithiobacillus sp. MC6.1]